MIFLIFAILSSTTNHLLFKAFGKYKIDILTAIVVNYAVCSVIGFTSSFEILSKNSLLTNNWFFFSVGQGALLFICFYLMGRTTTSHGVTVASVSSRISVAIPTLMAFILYNDLLTITKIGGILIALISLSLSAGNKNNNSESHKMGYLLPAMLFVAFGMHSTLVKFVQAFYLENSSYHIYTMTSFFFAFLISGIFLLWRNLQQFKKLFKKDIIAGIILGCTNYAAFFFLISVLGIPGWESSALFPTMSISVVGFSSFGAWLIFKENISLRMIFVIFLGAVSIILLNL